MTKKKFDKPGLLEMTKHELRTTNGGGPGELNLTPPLPIEHLVPFKVFLREGKARFLYDAQHLPKSLLPPFFTSPNGYPVENYAVKEYLLTLNRNENRVEGVYKFVKKDKISQKYTQVFDSDAINRLPLHKKGFECIAFMNENGTTSRVYSVSTNDAIKTFINQTGNPISKGDAFAEHIYAIPGKNTLNSQYLLVDLEKVTHIKTHKESTPINTSTKACIPFEEHKDEDEPELTPRITKDGPYSIVLRGAISTQTNPITTKPKFQVDSFFETFKGEYNVFLKPLNQAAKLDLSKTFGVKENALENYYLIEHPAIDTGGVMKAEWKLVLKDIAKKNDYCLVYEKKSHLLENSIQYGEKRKYFVPATLFVPSSKEYEPTHWEIAWRVNPEFSEKTQSMVNKIFGKELGNGFLKEDIKTSEEDRLDPKIHWSMISAIDLISKGQCRTNFSSLGYNPKKMGIGSKPVSLEGFYLAGCYLGSNGTTKCMYNAARSGFHLQLEDLFMGEELSDACIFKIKFIKTAEGEPWAIYKAISEEKLRMHRHIIGDKNIKNLFLLEKNYKNIGYLVGADELQPLWQAVNHIGEIKFTKNTGKDLAESHAFVQNISINDIDVLEAEATYEVFDLKNKPFTEIDGFKLYKM